MIPIHLILLDARIGPIGLPSAFFILLLAVFVIRIFYLLLLQRTMEKVSSANRQMSPTQVWLELIPLVNLVWQFFNVENICKSLEKEFHTQGKYVDVKGAAAVGKVYCILCCCVYIPVPFLSPGAMVASLICWIIFWVRIANLKNQL